MFVFVASNAESRICGTTRGVLAGPSVHTRRPLRACCADKRRCFSRAFKCRSRDQSRRLHTAAASAESSDSAPQPSSLFIFGFGYVALGLARLLRNKGWRVSGTCRGTGRQNELASQGFASFLFDTDALSLGLGRQGAEALRQATHVLIAISPSSSGETSPIAWILGRESRQMRTSLQWVGFLSTTSVYGDHQGEWVTEESEARATEGSGLARKQAEMAWLQLHTATGMPVHIFRLAGIYGPGRSALEAALQSALLRICHGELIDSCKAAPSSKRSGKRFTSRCHVYDICQALMASMAAPSPGEVYNVADDDPTSREEVLAFVRNTLMAGSPRSSAGVEGSSAAEATPAAEQGIPNAEASADLAPPVPKRRSGEKRVRNDKMKEDLGVRLKFPSFREGLAAIHAGKLLPFQ